jgi:proline dehydrogenase
MLISDGNYPAIGTHDMALIRSAIEHAQRHQIAAERYEFQMLYGVRRDEQNRLVDDGFRMRVYVPFGTEWYPYFTRRIAERPANALFVIRQLGG